LPGRHQRNLQPPFTWRSTVTGNPLSRRDVVRGAVFLGVGAATGGLSIAGAPSALAAPDQAAALAVPVPTIASRATWGARSPGGLSVIPPSPDKIVTHPPAGANTTNYTQAQAFAMARSIQNFHMDDNGWADSGQHFTISRGGYIMEGRHNSLTRL